LLIFLNQTCRSPEEKKIEKILIDYSQVEVLVSDFSKKITGYLPDMKVPASFNEVQYEKLLKENYPNQEKVSSFFTNHKVKVKAVNEKYFSVIVCSRDGIHKKIEDLNCTLGKVDYRYWDQNEQQQPKCVFEITPEKICP